MDARQAGADTELHVRQETVLGILGAHRRRARIACADFNVDVADCRVKRARVGVGHIFVDRRRGAVCARRAVAGEKQHISLVALVLVAGRVFPEHEDRPRRAITDHADARPDVDRVAEPIAPLGYEDDTLPGSLLDPVDGPLQRSCVVGDAIALRREGFLRQEDSLGIIQPPGVIGRRPYEASCQQGPHDSQDHPTAS
jgi:hypothetical protein